MTRLAYTDEDRAARAYIITAMEEAGLAVRIDAAGNIFARRAGRVPEAPAVLSGSHLDTVPRGGPLDGALGVVAALEAVRAIDRAGLSLAHPLEVVVFADEEGSRFNSYGFTGSRALLGTLTVEDLATIRDEDGITLAEAWRRWDLDPARVGEARRAGTTIHALVELHIEQGAVLDSARLPVGVVTGIAASSHLTLRLSGVADHAGATPMTLRHDALAGAAEVILAAERIARDEVGPPAVATVGKLDVVPGARNVIPGEVTLVVDVRHVSAAERDRAIARIEEEAEAIAARRGLCSTRVKISRVEPPQLSAVVIEAIETACRALNVPYLRLPSGAGHDTMNVARIARAGMIFVPSLAVGTESSAGHGRSHCPEEATRPEDIVTGVRVLAETLVRLGDGRSLPASP